MTLQELRDYAATLPADELIDVNDGPTWLTARYCRDQLGFSDPSASYSQVEDAAEFDDHPYERTEKLPESYARWNRNARFDPLRLKTNAATMGDINSYLFLAGTLVEILDELIAASEKV